MYVFLTLGSCRINAQIVGEWTWESGSSSPNAAAVYGTKGVAAAGNHPGNRDSPSGWMDGSGNFWVFGGDDASANSLNDLWKYSPTTKLWTWVSGSNTGNSAGTYGTKGTFAAANAPPARFGQAMTMDASGNFWLFGGAPAATLGTTAFLNDLWEYKPSTNQWTWVSGSNSTGAPGVYGTKGTGSTANVPGGRIYPTIWTDATGNIWIFSGLGLDKNSTADNLNDLWEYTPSTKKWTWVTGSNTVNATGVYGTKGTAATANTPGARNASSGWRDAAGNFWIFAGATGAFFTGGNSYNDLWKYTPSTAKWTWVSGNNTAGGTGVHGTEGVAAAANMPGARYSQGVTVDVTGNFWLFGGLDGGTGSAYDDLWTYSPTSNEWAWVDGSTGFNAGAVHGTLGVAAASNTPGGRGFSSVWADATNNIWVTSGYDGANDNNDLFEWSIINTLAVRDLELQGVHQPKANELSWYLTGDFNTAYFSVERSANASPFTAIGSSPAAGNTFSDTHLTAGSLLYRVKEVDIDSSIVYSPVIALAGAGSSTTVYPNPTRGAVTLQLGGDGLSGTVATLYDLSGKAVAQWMITSGTQWLDVSHFAVGTYLLRLANGESVKIIKK